MFTYKKLNEYEFEISDYPYGFASIALTIFIITLYNAFWNNLDSLLILIGLTTPLVWILLLQKRKTTINLKLNRIFHTERNLFSRKHSMINMQNGEVIKVEAIEGKSHLPQNMQVGLTDNRKHLIIIGSDIIGTKHKKYIAETLQSLFIK